MLAVDFRHLVRGDCRQCQKGSFSSDVGDYYRHISITPLLPNVFEKILVGKLRNLLKVNSLLPPSQFSYRGDRGICDALLTMTLQLQVALKRGMEGRLVQLDFSAAFERVNPRLSVV